jgi:hypothetical protein
MMKIMNKRSTLKKTNIITLDEFRPLQEKIPTSKELEKMQDDQVVGSFHEACIKISDKIDIKGYALVAWDENGVPCISWSTGHNKSPISEMLLPTFTQSCFQGILNKKLSTTEDL